MVRGWWSTSLGARGDPGVQAQGPAESYSVTTIGAPSFQESEVAAGVFVLCGCLEELQGQRRRKNCVWAACLEIRQGPWGHEAACVAQRGFGCQAQRPQVCSLAWRVEGGALVLSPSMESLP